MFNQPVFTESFQTFDNISKYLICVNLFVNLVLFNPLLFDNYSLAAYFSDSYWNFISLFVDVSIDTEESIAHSGHAFPSQWELLFKSDIISFLDIFILYPLEESSEGFLDSNDSKHKHINML